MAPWRRRTKQGPDRPGPTVPNGQRVYAIGDIHGRADLLETMAQLIENDVAGNPAADCTTIFLGDYVDRGPGSATVMDRLARRAFPTPIVTLCGNHEDILVGFMRGGVDLEDYRQLGGEATLTSYGIEPAMFAAADAVLRDKLLRAAIPERHHTFLAALRLSVTVGDYFFCHAGVRPGVPLDQQSAHDLLWIRDAFLSSAADFGKVVVHGHTPMDEPLVRPNGIGIDTHAFASGVLTALVLEGAGRRFLRTG